MINSSIISVCLLSYFQLQTERRPDCPGRLPRVLRLWLFPQDYENMSASTPTQPAGPPVPPVKPILSSPGAYMANFQPSNPLGGGGGGSGPVSGTPTPGGGVVAPITAGIHSSNKTHEKPTIAARPIPPPTLPKYSSSFNKIDRDRNEFTKLDKAEREKVS